MMEDLGATLVTTDTGDSNVYFDAEFTVLLFEFKVQIADYRRAAEHPPSARSLISSPSTSLTVRRR
jgi:hypothetical protein